MSHALGHMNNRLESKCHLVPMALSDRVRVGQSLNNPFKGLYKDIQIPMAPTNRPIPTINQRPKSAHGFK